ncbi:MULTISPECIES: TraR/DksA family transcriptional regulator [Streptomyces]|uniref:TraR/DksA C4-type zinc finger protein n=3 Tax=Streptomyces rochei group TaxID=2867164 RepID=A0AAX3ZRU3_STRRO|nr:MULTISPECIES: TraR/DksA C4-type zinc finger protein [Streptomyces]RIH61166.1 molecular chaperone DnaK [Streptomyces sp. SHP22-7]WDI21302.1 TraR/DksA C4-type zinc finger protein [Streptomyces enissocaesilis]KYK14691.1 molecular chaperone DnaK [Streptomyces sp. CC71]MBJ6622032.1 TraR/DksA C4-type zinc finger protein [Streptomyces sp. DHE17-7]MBQ0883282.1 TraR/DksA C4-type zinc finger protein [Streptomyces sp. RT42]
MSLDASRIEPRPERLTSHEARQRLEHARNTRMTQLQALGESGQADDQLMSAQTAAIERVLKEIDEAFARIDAGTYGTCMGCGKPVPGERLEILPYTRYCVACQRRAAA